MLLRVFDPKTKELVHLHPLRASLENTDFLGPALPTHTVLKIARSEIHPDTHEPFEDCQETKQPPPLQSSAPQQALSSSLSQFQHSNSSPRPHSQYSQFAQYSSSNPNVHAEASSRTKEIETAHVAPVAPRPSSRPDVCAVIQDVANDVFKGQDAHVHPPCQLSLQLTSFLLLFTHFTLHIHVIDIS
jgi:hypothetical protein